MKLRLTHRRILLLLILLICCNRNVLETKAQTSSASPSPTEAVQGSSSDTDRYLREGLKGIAEQSRALSGWGLTIIGASIIAIASTSYFRPRHKRVRLIYLLFLPGWLFIGLSIRSGDKVSRRFAAGAFAQERKLLREIGSLMNGDFASQLTCFQWGLTFFSVWLIAFTIWWIASDIPQARDS